MKPLLSDKVVLVTGAATGIGEAIARRVVDEGGFVMVHDRDAEGAQRVAGEIGTRASFAVGDLSDDATPTHLIDAALHAFGRIDGLVNNAAMTDRSNIDSLSPDHLDRMLRVNLRAPLMLIRAALPHFRRQRSGVVLNIGSVNAYCGEPELLAYSISKGALMTMTRNLGDILAREGIRVNQLNPGWTLTPNERALKEKEGFLQGWETRVSDLYAPSGRLLQPSEIAAHAVFWLSDAAGPVSGSVFEVEQHPFIGRNRGKDVEGGR